MSRTSSKELFDLIKSLSKLEKRYFKVFASRHVIGKENNYVRLFDLIDRQSHHDEEKILRKASITKKQLENWKRYLYKLILRSEENYHLENNSEKRIKQLILHTENLFDKGLYSQCLKLLAKAKELATKYEKYLLLIEILTWEETTLRRMHNMKELQQHLDTGFREREQALAKTTTINKYRKLYLQQYLLSTKESISRSREHTEQFERIASHPFMKEEKLATSYEAKLWYHYIHCHHFWLISEIENCYHATKKRVAFIEQHPHQIAEDPFHYMIALDMFAIMCTELGKNEEFMNVLEKLRSLPVKTADLQNKIFAVVYNMELSHYIKQVHYQKGLGIIPEIKRGIERIGEKFDKQYKLHIYYNFSILYFSTKNYRAALRWLKIILNDSEKDIRKDIYCFARILNLIIHYEMGNQELLESIVRSTYRFLYKRKRLFELETVVLNFIRNTMPKIKTQKQTIKAFQVLRKELIRITKDNFEKRALEYFDIISWLESKIENKSFEEIIRQKGS